MFLYKIRRLFSGGVRRILLNYIINIEILAKFREIFDCSNHLAGVRVLIVIP